MSNDLLSALVLAFCAIYGLAVLVSALLWSTRRSERSPAEVRSQLYGRDEHGSLSIEVQPMDEPVEETK